MQALGVAPAAAAKKKEAANCGDLSRGDKALRASAFLAFIDVMQETRLFLLDA